MHGRLVALAPNTLELTSSNESTACTHLFSWIGQVDNLTILLSAFFCECVRACHSRAHGGPRPTLPLIGPAAGPHPLCSPVQSPLSRWSTRPLSLLRCPPRPPAPVSLPAHLRHWACSPCPLRERVDTGLPVGPAAVGAVWLSSVPWLTLGPVPAAVGRRMGRSGSWTSTCRRPTLRAL